MKSEEYDSFFDGYYAHLRDLVKLANERKENLQCCVHGIFHPDRKCLGCYSNPDWYGGTYVPWFCTVLGSTGIHACFPPGISSFCGRRILQRKREFGNSELPECKICQQFSLAFGGGCDRSGLQSVWSYGKPSDRGSNIIFLGYDEEFTDATTVNDRVRGLRRYVIGERY